MRTRIGCLGAALVLGAAALVLAGCSGGGSGGGDAVVAAFYPIAFAAQQVTGGTVGVRNLTPAGAEPHDLELTPGDVHAVHAAKVVLYFGDGFMPGLETAVKDRKGRSVDLLAQLRRQEGNGGGPPGDPHVWLDPVRYAALVRLVGTALGDEAATIPLTRRLGRLDAAYRKGLAHCARREIVTSHAAFGYLARRYGLVQVPLEGLTPEAEPSAKDIARLVDVVRRSGTTTVFFETLISPKLAETVAREAGVGTAVLDPLEGLSTSRIAAGADYFTVMRENLATLQKALGCSP
jgi:zinc transport system substrate-binding protein